MTSKYVFSIELPKGYNLELTLYPSFTYPFYRSLGNVLVKDIGVCRGTTFTFYSDRVVVEGNCSRDTIEELLGLWFNPWNYIDDVDPEYRDYVQDLIERYHGVRLAISSEDKIWLFISVFLSRTTSFHTNTVRWIRKIALHGLDHFIREGYGFVGNSFQLKQLWILLNTTDLVKLISSFNPRSLHNSWRIRRKLLKYRFVGVKTVDAFLLFSTPHSFFTPIDRHYKRFLMMRFQLRGYREPLSHLCRRYDCSFCPLASRCLSFFSRRVFGRLGGWIQTLSYLAGNRLVRI